MAEKYRAQNENWFIRITKTKSRFEFYYCRLRELRYFSVAFGELRRRRAIRNNTTKLRVGGYGGAAERGDIPK